MRALHIQPADRRRRRLTLLTIAAGTFVSVLDQTGVTLALPLMTSEFDATIPFVQWVALGYMLATGSLLLPAGRISDMIGRKAVYCAGFVVFVLGAAAATLAPNLMAVIAFRIAQGAGAAMIQANGMAILTTTFPASERGRVIGMFMTMVGLGAVMGPIVAGLLVDAFGWRGVFAASVPLGALSLIAALIVLERGAPSAGADGGGGIRRVAGGFDWLGALMSAGGLAAFLLVMTNAYRLGWLSPIVLGAAALSVALLVGFAFWERRAPQPMLDLELFRRRVFALGSSAGFFGFLAGNAVFSMMPFFLQGVLDLSPRTAGLYIAPAALGFALAGPVSGILSDRVGARRIEFAGLAVLAASMLILARISPQTPAWLASVAMAMQGLGMGIYYTPNTASILNVVDRERYGVATAFLNMVRNTASVAGVGLTTTIVTMNMAAGGFEPTLDAVAAGAAGVEDAFAGGLRFAFATLSAFIGGAIILTYIKPSAPPGGEPEPRSGGEDRP